MSPVLKAQVHDCFAIRTPRRAARTYLMRELAELAVLQSQNKNVSIAAIAIRRKSYLRAVGRDGRIVIVVGAESQLLSCAADGRQAEKVAEHSEYNRLTVGRHRHIGAGDLRRLTLQSASGSQTRTTKDQGHSNAANVAGHRSGPPM